MIFSLEIWAFLETLKQNINDYLEFHRPTTQQSHALRTALCIAK